MKHLLFHRWVSAASIMRAARASLAMGAARGAACRKLDVAPTACFRHDDPPRAENATIPIEKIRDYVLNPDHAVGRHKAQVIAAGTELGRTDYRDMVDQIQRGIMVYEAVEHHLVDRNKQFYVEMPINGPTGSMIVRTIWIYEEGNDGPRLTTVYPSRRPA